MVQPTIKNNRHKSNCQTGLVLTIKPDARYQASGEWERRYSPDFERLAIALEKASWAKSTECTNNPAWPKVCGPHEDVWQLIPPSVLITPIETDLEREFRLLVQRWLEETEHISSIKKACMHPAYQRIIGMGRHAIPLLLRELQRSPDHWFWALNAITGEDPGQLEDTFDGAVRAWLDWGHENGYL